jgi:multiple sugar transport system ATP-binding protein
MVFQSYALYPHLSVARNIEFPLRQRGMAKEERTAKVKEAAVTLGLDTLLDRKPSQLSGGQRQRVALARAIVRDPQVFLMDEPLSNLDAALRVQTRADIVALQSRLSTTTLYVTHDQVEAMTMGDRIAVMSHGVLQQVAAPEDLYDRPANTFVAGFLGSPGMNLLPGTIGRGADGGATVEVSGGSVPLSPPLAAAAVGAGAVVLGLRPEALRIDPEGPLRADVTIVELLGAETHVISATPDGSRLIVRQPPQAAKPAPGDQVRVAIDPDPAALHLFDAASTQRLAGP